MVNEFCGFKHGVIGTDKLPADTTLNNMKKADLIKLLHTAQHNYESLNWFYNNAVSVNMKNLQEMKEIRAKAIDEAMEASAKAICVGCGYLEGYKCTYKGCNCGVSKPMLESVVKALEQMKGGAVDGINGHS